MTRYGEARRNEPRRFDPRYVKKLEREGMSSSEALLEACTTMAGAYEDREGNINSYQTACPVLNYDESLTESEEVVEARNEQQDQLLRLMRAQFPKEKDRITKENLDHYVDLWMDLPEEKRIRELPEQEHKRE